MENLKIFSDEEILREYRMKKLIRYNNRNRITDEDISQHSYFVCLFCLKIMSKLNLKKETKYNVLTKAILHDVAEIDTSDLPHDVKIKYPEMNDILKKIECTYYEDNWNDYLDVLKNENPIEDAIVKLADSYSVLQYCMNECELGNDSKVIQGIYSNAAERVCFFTEKINKLRKEHL